MTVWKRHLAVTYERTHRSITKVQSDETASGLNSLLLFHDSGLYQ